LRSPSRPNTTRRDTNTSGDESPEVGQTRTNSVPQRLNETFSRMLLGSLQRIQRLVRWRERASQPQEGNKFERTDAPLVKSTLKGEPQGRDRHGIRPADNGWSKASRACETLRTQRDPRVGYPRDELLAVCRENAEGEENRKGGSSAPRTFGNRVLSGGRAEKL
jgi:hypothetical protein